MKRLTAAILSLALLLSFAGTAEGGLSGMLGSIFNKVKEQTKEESAEPAGLDEIFERGPVLVPVSLWDEDFSKYELITTTKGVLGGTRTTRTPISDEMAKEFLQSAIALSVSPDGGVLFVINGGAYMLRGTTVTAMYTTEKRGVKDKYGNLQKTYMAINRISTECVAWSPDGRYCVITNRRRVMENANASVDPMLFDTQTGEVFLIATYSNKFMDGAAMELATFSPDSKSVYYMVYGGFYEGRYTLIRYDIEKNKVTVLKSDDEMGPDYDGIYVMSNGDVLALSYNRERESRVLEYVEVQNGSVEISAHDFTEKGWMPVQLEYSRESNTAIARGSSAIKGLPTILRVMDMSNLSGMQESWALSDVNDAYLTRVQNIADYANAQGDSTLVHVVRISPDGKYALALGTHPGGAFAVMIRLADKAVKRLDVEGLDMMGIACRTGYIVGAEWSMDGTILLAVDGKSRAFRIV